MEFKDQSELYFQRMDSAVDQKAELLRWIKGPAVAELGPGSGSLTELIAEEITEILSSLEHEKGGSISTSDNNMKIEHQGRNPNRVRD